MEHKTNVYLNNLLEDFKTQNNMKSKCNIFCLKLSDFYKWDSAVAYPAHTHARARTHTHTHA
jgi:hypothetical protein